MKKLDKLILGSFIGPFFLTFVVVDFILLTVNMLKYFDEIFGKGLSFFIYVELFSYFVISISPMALPLAVLLSALMTFGNLGEHFELTAIKSSGISLIRALRPIGIFVVFLSFLAFLSNNYLVPQVNLKTFGLLYDIRMKSPALDIKEGVFYSGIPNYSIKVNRKLDDIRLQDIIIYDHTEGQGNVNVILADSGRMESFYHERYMRLTLNNGTSYKESRSQRGINEKPVDFSRTNFSENVMVFNLESFQMNRTPEDLWSTNRSIKNISQLKEGLDSMASEINQIVYYNYGTTESSYPYFSRNRKFVPPADIEEKKLAYDSIRTAKIQERKAKQLAREGNQLVEGVNSLDTTAIDFDSLYFATEDSLYGTPADTVVTDKLEAARQRGFVISDTTDSLEENTTTSKFKDSLRLGKIRPNSQNTLGKAATSQVPLENRQFSIKEKTKMDSIIRHGNYKSRAATVGLNNARTIKNNFSQKKTAIDNLEREYRRFEIAWYQKYTTAFACIVMFMIGAPLGAIIKKGGLGMPVLLSIIFFIIYYMLTITGEKWAKEGITSSIFGTWFSILVLLPIGLFFLKQARKDARLFEADVYIDMFNKTKGWFQRKFAKV